MTVKSSKIIINADDFGLGPGIDEGIIRLAEHGRISSTSIMACGEHFRAGVRSLLQRTPNLGTGVHLCLDEEIPVLPASEVPTLVDSSGKFLTRSVFLQRLWRRIVKLEEVEKELSAQVEKVIDSGIRVTHIDGHGHVHVFPWIADILKSVTRRFGITKARMPLEPIRIQQYDWLKHLAIRLLLNHWTQLSRRKGFLTGMLVPQSFFGVSFGGRLSENALLRLPISRGHVTEIMVHPGLPTQGEIDRYSSWNYSWQTTYETLLSDKIDYMLEKNQGYLINFGDLE